MSRWIIPQVAGVSAGAVRMSTATSNGWKPIFKQRFSPKGDAAGIDPGVRYVDGNPLSLAQERILSLGFGLIF